MNKPNKINDVKFSTKRSTAISRIRQPRSPLLTTLALLLALTAATLITYWPGTSGGFLLDDEVNLNDLGRYGGIHDLASLQTFVMSGISGPSGRPLALLSFVIDAQNWPADPYPFLRTNILIHAINGLLIFFCVATLIRLSGREAGSARWMAFGCAALWLLHPLQVSTVLYIVQRMTELATLFTLSGVLLYLHGRRRLDDNPGVGYLYMSAAVVGGTVLGTLCKETGVLLPLYIAVIEFTLLAQRPRPQHWRHWAAVMLGLPIVALLAYLAGVALQHESGYAHRDFTLYERLITQPLVLLDYLFQIVLPLRMPSLIHDDFPVSRSLLEPLTLGALLTFIAVLVAAIRLHRRQPLFTFAILWFFGGHLLEGSTVPLELYFEHRNYLPLLGPLLALVYYSQRLITAPRLGAATLALFAVVLAGVSWNYSQIWGDKGRLLATWAERQPESLRARVYYTDEILKTKSMAESFALLEQLRADFPQTVSIEIVYNTALCLQGRLTEVEFKQLLELAQTRRLDSNVENDLRYLLETHLRGQCQIPPQALLALIETVEKNARTPADQSRRIALLYMKSRLYQHYKQIGSALNALDEIFALNASVEIALKEAAILVDNSQFQAAQIQLNKAEAMDRMRHRWTPSKREDIEKLRALIPAQG